MDVQHIACDIFTNVSEEVAYKAIEKHLRREAAPDRVYVLTNLAHGLGRAGQPDEVDIVVCGSGGVAVIEVKHWDRARIKSNSWEVEDHADLITQKAKRIAGRLRQVQPNLGFVPASILLTRETKSLRQSGRSPEVRGVRLYGLGDIDALVGAVGSAGKAGINAEKLAAALSPRGLAGASGDLRRIGRIGELKKLSDPLDRFRRVYSGRDTTTGDRVTAYLYDLSATTGGNPEQLARREFEAVQKLQKSPFLPILVDSYQPCPGYPGELYFFSLADSSAITVEEASKDPAWTVDARIAFAAGALRALASLHSPSDTGASPVVHRAITTESVRVRSNGRPLFAGWRWARLPEIKTITAGTLFEAQDDFAAPEVKKNGLAFADTRSDTYSLCKVLQTLFQIGAPAREPLGSGLTDSPEARASLTDIATAIEMHAAPAPLGEKPIPPINVLVQPHMWDEGHMFEWERAHYKVVSRLGEGGAGCTFKLEQLDGATGEPIGAFVGKVVLDDRIGPAALDAYRKIRSIADHPCLSGVYQTAPEWSPDKLIALLKWRKGEPLDAWRGEYLQLLAETVGVQEGNETQALMLKWIRDLCEALNVLHSQGWVHGDISPSNILVSEDAVTLIDFDLAGAEGSSAVASGTVPYTSTRRRDGRTLSASDDLFSLAASLFHVLTDRLPFVTGGVRRDDIGLAWEAGEQERHPVLARFLNKATNPDQLERFRNSAEALVWLEAASKADTPLVGKVSIIQQPLRPNVVSRVREILRCYPGSQFGNAETRGLDSDFAHETYVETDLDRVIPRAIRAGEVALVILCGNAGDGKTAFLQHLAAGLELHELPSDRRVWDGELNGRRVKINLDGAASWKDKSANDLLDDLFKPFMEGLPPSPPIHLVAVNDGRLMEWVESYEARHSSTRLTRQIAATLGSDERGLDPHVRLVELNLRSLVGGVDLTKQRVSTEFVEELCYRLVGGENAPELWKPCTDCSARARCSMRSSAEMFGASRDPAIRSQGILLRDRLVAALQSVHQRNLVHITARELKATLSYVLFGVNDCSDLHKGVGVQPHDPGEFAFDPESPSRQGELLRELTRLDPALEAHARIDRYLLARGAPSPAHGAPRFPNISLRSARRRAYFKWSDDQIQQVGGDAFSLGLCGGRRFAAFRDFPLMSQAERHKVRDSLCRGLSRLEALPEIALRGTNVVPIRIVPRTPTESAFWVGKSLDRFSLEAEAFSNPPGLETLHRYLSLSYRMTDGRSENLIISLELFALLMDLAEGVQIFDTFSDDVFANLDIFTRRIAHEDERSLLAWNPADGERTYKIEIETKASKQVVKLQPMGGS